MKNYRIVHSFLFVQQIISLGNYFHELLIIFFFLIFFSSLYNARSGTSFYCLQFKSFISSINSFKMFTSKKAQQLYQSFFPLYIFLKVFGMFPSKFDSSYSLCMDIYNKIYSLSVISISPVLILIYFLKLSQTYANVSQLINSALEVQTIIETIFLTAALIYQYERCEKLQKIYNKIKEIDKNVRFKGIIFL